MNRIRINTARSRAVLLALCFGTAAGVQAQNINHARVIGGLSNNDQSAVDTPVVIGTAGPVSLSTLPGAEAYFAQAAGDTGTLRGLAALKSNHNNVAGATCCDDHLSPEVTSVFDWTKPVLPGTSGLAAGAPIMAHFVLGISGTLSAGAFAALSGTTGPLPSGQSYSALALGSLRYQVVDLDAPGHTFALPDLDFSYQADLRVQMTDPLGVPINDTNIQFRQMARNFGRSGPLVWSGNSDTTTTLPGKVYTFNSQALAPAPFAFDVDTFVGHRLAIHAELRALADGFSEGPGTRPLYAALADFSHTFDAELSSNVAGIEFGNDSPGVAALSAVPEPGTLALCLLGVGVLTVRRLGQRQP